MVYGRATITLELPGIIQSITLPKYSSGDNTILKFFGSFLFMIVYSKKTKMKETFFIHIVCLKRRPGNKETNSIVVVDH